MVVSAIVLFAAAFLEISGDALTRAGLRGRPAFLAGGAIMLFMYGVLVNQGQLDFGRLMGVYIAVFFVVSQAVAFAFFRDVPDFKTILGGVLILVGGAVIML
jgi:small multidrug resistance family-3 protein